MTVLYLPKYEKSIHLQNYIKKERGIFFLALKKQKGDGVAFGEPKRKLFVFHKKITKRFEMEQNI